MGDAAGSSTAPPDRKSRISRRRLLVFGASIGMTAGCLQLESQSDGDTSTTEQETRTTPSQTEPEESTSTTSAGVSLKQEAVFESVGPIAEADFEYAGDNVFFRTDENAFAIHPANGELLWEVDGLSPGALMGVTPNSAVFSQGWSDSSKIVRYQDGVLQETVDIGRHWYLRNAYPSNSYDEIFYKKRETPDPLLVCRDLKTLEEKWRIQVLDFVGTSTEETIFLSTSQTDFKVNLETGETTEFEHGEDIPDYRRLVLHGSNLYGYSDETLSAISMETFSPEWTVNWSYSHDAHEALLDNRKATQELGQHNPNYPIVTCEGGRSVYAADGTGVHRIDQESGDVVWTVPIGDEILTRPVYTGSAVVVGTSAETVALNTDDGTKLWNKGGRTSERPLLWNGLIWLPTEGLSGHDPKTGETLVSTSTSLDWIWPHQGNLLAGGNETIYYYSIE